jgi:hypothetical protein
MEEHYMTKEDYYRIRDEVYKNAGMDKFDFDLMMSRVVEKAVEEERESCLEACRMYVDLNEPPDGFQNGVECCIAVITHKDDPDVMARIKARGQG